MSFDGNELLMDRNKSENKRKSYGNVRGVDLAWGFFGGSAFSEIHSAKMCKRKMGKKWFYTS